MPIPSDPNVPTPIWQRSEEEQRQWWMDQYAGNPPGDTDVEEQSAEDSRAEQFGQVTSAAGIPTEGVTEELLTRLLEQAGVDVEHEKVAAFVQFYPYSDPDATDEEKLQDFKDAQWFVEFYAAQPEYQKAGVVTPYAVALQDSGFGLDFTFPVSPGAQQLAAREGITPAAVGPKTVTQPETGWMLFDNGVLVDKTGLDPMSSVIFKPGSLAPGSSWWYDSIRQSWSKEQVATWRQRLVDAGYLPKGSEKTEGWDEQFRSALTAFHVYRYYNGGKAVPFDAGATQINPTLTPEDMQHQLRNNTRQQFLAVFGDEPSDAELDSWTRFVIKQATDLQKQYMRRGVDEGTALARATSEAGETVAEKLWENPIASFQRESEDENTKLHDGLLRAASATEGLLG